MNNITYLFGAGASYNACPILNEMGDKMMELSKVLGYDFNFKPEERVKLKNSKEKLVWLIGYYGCQAQMLNTIDTCARKFSFLRGKEEALKELKYAVSLFFTLWSLTECTKWKERKSDNKVQLFDKIDYRYINLLATFLKKGEEKPVLRGDVKFLTWNYDLQIQNTYRVFSELSHLDYNAVDEYLPFIPSKHKELSIVHLNGYHDYEYYGAEEGSLFVPNDVKRDLESLVDFFSFTLEPEHYDKSLHCGSKINYAWENSELTKLTREHALNIMSQTNTLVIVGYSFPPFNHEIDKLLFEKARKSLKKIVIQDPKVDKDYIYETFGISEVKIKVVRDTQQFIMPSFYERQTF